MLYRLYSLHTLTVLFSIICGVIGCGDDRKQVYHALYEWRSRVSYGVSDRSLFDSLTISRLYVHFFDVQWKASQFRSVPQSTIHFDSPLLQGIEIVPTIYLTNEVMKQVRREEELGVLARNIQEKISSLITEGGIDTVEEIQIDCDWTASSKNPYFTLLRELKKLYPTTILSATIRLHQVKYRAETGVPPVDRGMLMVYNVGEVTSFEEKNSIVDAEEIKGYLGELDNYPLPLDIALPVFSWGVRFHFNRFAAIIDNVRAQDLQGHPDFTQVGENRWQARRETELRGDPIFPGDIIRIEESRIDEVEKIAERIASDIDEARLTVSLYRYDPHLLSHHDLKALRTLYEVFD